MRPLSLQMCAFGPYPEREVVDFRELGDHSLFLVSGATGAGKSAILDGICFALFGTASGSERTAKAFRSHHAEPSTPTSVALLFRLKHTTYRVERGPEQQRPKQRGEGTTTEKPFAYLYEVSDAGETLVADGTKEVNHALEARLGYGPEQFRQLVVLPQGEFRTLVTAKSGEREKVFGRLFNTQRYADLGRGLSDAFKAVKSDLDGNDKTRLGLLEHVGAESETALDETIAAGTAEITTAEAEAATLGTLATAARDELERGRATEKALGEAKAAQDALALLEGKVDAVNAGRKELAQANHAATVDDVLKHRTLRQQELATAKRDLILSRRRVHRESAGDFRCRSRAARVAGRRAASPSTPDRDEAGGCGGGYETACDAPRQQARIVEQREAHLKQQSEALQDAQKLQAHQEDLATEAEQATKTVETLAALALSRRLQAEVVGLAESLQAGEPCPVCGRRPPRSSQAGAAMRIRTSPPSRPS